MTQTTSAVVPARADSLNASVLAARVAKLYETARSAIWANPLAVLAIVLVAYGNVPNARILGWMLLILVVLVLRFAFIVWRSNQSSFPQPAPRLAWEFCVSTATVGVGFGAGFVLLVPSLDDHERMLMLWAFAGMAAGGSVSMAYHRWSYWCYMVPLLVPPACYSAWLAFTAGTAIAIVETYIIVAYLATMMVVQSIMDRTMRESLAVQHEKAALADQLEAANQTLIKDRDSYRTSALTDGLTGIGNRRRFDELLDVEWRRCARDRTPLGCLLLDIDHFKKFNDKYGHDDGDICLTRVARTIAEVAQRGGDHAARYGGEEFVVLLPNTDRDGVAHVGERIRQSIAALEIAHASSPHTVVTVSVGAASILPDTDGAMGVLIKRADKALYAAKHAGRNRIGLDELEDDPTLTQFTEPPVVSGESAGVSGA